MGVNQFSTVMEALEALRKKGFTESFVIDERGLRGNDNKEVLKPEDMTIIEYHRFEGTSNPDDMSVVYAMESRNGRRGIVVDAYGTYANPLTDQFLKRARLKEGLS